MSTFAQLDIEFDKGIATIVLNRPPANAIDRAMYMDIAELFSKPDRIGPELKASDLINRGGANVYPAEIERALREESGVHGCVVAGRADAPLGQPVAVYVQPSAGVNGKELIERLQRRCCVAT